MNRAREAVENTTLTTDLLLACGAVVLSILGIVGVFQNDLAAIAVIGVGVILLFQGANVVLRYTELLCEAGATGKARAAEVSRGITAEFLAGVAGIVLGILALLRIVPMLVCKISALSICFGHGGRAQDVGLHSEDLRLSFRVDSEIRRHVA